MRAIRWVSAVGLAWLGAFGCGGAGPTLEEGEVGVRGGDVVAPGARLLQGGEAAEERLPNREGLVAIERDGAVFFYHPSLGDARLDEETSRRAVGVFVSGVEPPEGSAAGGLVLRPGQSDVRSDTGVELSWPRAGAPLRVTNTSQRWVALTSDAVSRPYYLGPAGSELPTNLVDAFFDDVDAEGWSAETNASVQATDRLAVHGAILRAGPLLFLGSRLESARESRAADPVVSATLNYLDLAYLIVSGTETFLGLIPSECADGLTQSTLRSVAYEIADGALADDFDRDALRALYSDQLKSTANDWISCAIEASSLSSPFAALALGVFNTYLDIVAFGGWLVYEGVVGLYDAAFGASAYDVVDLQSSEPSVVATLPLASPAQDVEVLLSDAFVVTNDAVHHVEVEANGSLSEVAQTELTFGRGVALDGANVWTAATGVQLRGASALGARSTLGLGTQSYDLVTRGEYLFIAGGAYTHAPSTGLFAVGRLLDPSAIDGIELTGGVELAGGAVQDVVITADGRHAVALDEAGDVHVIDVQVPAGPRVVGMLPGSAGSVPRRGLAIDGDVVYVASDVLRVVSIADRTAPTQLFESSPDGARGVDVDGGRVYLTGGAGEGYLVVLDASTPSSPSVLSVVPLEHTGNAVDVYSGFAFVATIAGTAGQLVVVDL